MEVYICIYFFSFFVYVTSVGVWPHLSEFTHVPEISSSSFNRKSSHIQMIKLTIMQIICNLVFTRNFICIFISVVASLSSDTTQSPSAISSILVKQCLLQITFRMKHSNIHENDTRTVYNGEMLFLTVCNNWRSCVKNSVFRIKLYSYL